MTKAQLIAALAEMPDDSEVFCAWDSTQFVITKVTTSDDDENPFSVCWLRVYFEHFLETL